MKFAYALTLASAAAVANAFSADFFSGAQTGIFIMDEEQFKDYSCPEPEISQQVQQYLNMIEPAKMMFENMNQGQKSPALDYVAGSSKQIAKVISVFSDYYDGGEFCQGLIVAQ